MRRLYFLSLPLALAISITGCSDTDFLGSGGNIGGKNKKKNSATDTSGNDDLRAGSLETANGEEIDCGGNPLAKMFERADALLATGSGGGELYNELERVVHCAGVDTASLSLLKDRMTNVQVTSPPNYGVDAGPDAALALATKGSVGFSHWMAALGNSNRGVGVPNTHPSITMDPEHSQYLGFMVAGGDVNLATLVSEARGSVTARQPSTCVIISLGNIDISHFMGGCFVFSKGAISYSHLNAVTDTKDPVLMGSLSAKVSNMKGPSPLSRRNNIIKFVDGDFSVFVAESQKNENSIPTHKWVKEK